MRYEDLTDDLLLPELRRIELRRIADVDAGLPLEALMAAAAAASRQAMATKERELYYGTRRGPDFRQDAWRTQLREKDAERVRELPACQEVARLLNYGTL